MKHFDAMIVGAGPTTQNIAAALTESGEKVAVAALPDNPETLQSRLLDAFEKQTQPKKAAAAPSDFERPPQVEYYSGSCRFLSETTLQVGPYSVKADRFVIASGAAFYVPPIQGLQETPFQTPLSIFSSPSFPESAVVIGAGPIGSATAHLLTTRGCEVTLVTDKEKILDKEDADVGEVFANTLRNGGVRLVAKARVLQTRTTARNTNVTVENDHGRSEFSVQELILAAGLLPNTFDLNLGAAGVVTDDTGGIIVNEEMRTSNPRIWAMGAATGPSQSFPLEPYQAELIAHNMRAPFFGRRKMEPDGIVLFTLPGLLPLSRLGLTEEKARARHKNVISSASKDRDGRLIKLIAKQSGELLGAHAAGKEAAEIGLFFELAMRAGISLFDLYESRYFPKAGSLPFVQKSLLDWFAAGRS